MIRARAQIRITSGALRGRKLTCVVNPNLRPTPQRVREAFFNILGNAVPGRAFIDIFAGTGVVGLEALSRGASSIVLIEQDFRQAQEIRSHIELFRVAEAAEVMQADAYRWVPQVASADEPVNIYISPPFVHIQKMSDDLVEMIATLQDKVAADSLIVLQSEHGSKLDGHEAVKSWEERRYGRNQLLIWQKSEHATES